MEIINGEGKFYSSNSVIVKEKEYLADHIVIATGGYPTVPNIPGMVNYFKIISFPDFS